MINRLIRLAIIFVLMSQCAWMLAAENKNGAATSDSAGLPAMPSQLAGSPLEQRLLTDAADGSWDEHSLFPAAAIASGAKTDAEVGTLLNQFNTLAGELRARLPADKSPLARGEAVLAFLHRRLLYGGYDLQATEVARVLNDGRYNCVSATVFYNCLAREAGLTVQAVRLPHHTRSALVIGNMRMAVEPTCTNSLAVQLRKGESSGNGSMARDAASDSEFEAYEEPISDVALVAMIYYNRGVEALRRHEYEPAIRLNRMALVLDAANAEARGNLLNAINKQALALTAQRQYAAALDLIDSGLALSPEHRPLRENRAFIERYQNRFTPAGAMPN